VGVGVASSSVLPIATGASVARDVGAPPPLVARRLEDGPVEGASRAPSGAEEAAVGRVQVDSRQAPELTIARRAGAEKNISRSAVSTVVSEPERSRGVAASGAAASNVAGSGAAEEGTAEGIAREGTTAEGIAVHDRPASAREIARDVGPGVASQAELTVARRADPSAERARVPAFSVAERVFAAPSSAAALSRQEATQLEALEEETTSVASAAPRMVLPTVSIASTPPAQGEMPVMRSAEGVSRRPPADVHAPDLLSSAAAPATAPPTAFHSAAEPLPFSLPPRAPSKDTVARAVGVPAPQQESPTVLVYRDAASLAPRPVASSAQSTIVARAPMGPDGSSGGAPAADSAGAGATGSVNVARLAERVTRMLVRQIEIERERRGVGRW
jgi:hypothetical protein